MRLSPVHALFYAARSMPAALASCLPSPSIDDCINGHAGPVAASSCVDQLIGQLRGASMADARRELARVRDGTHTRYQATGARWLKRLETDDARKWWAGRAGLTGDELAAYDRSAPPFRWSQADVVIVPRAPGAKEIPHSEISQCEKPEILPQPYQRAFLAALEKAPQPVSLVYRHRW